MQFCHCFQDIMVSQDGDSHLCATTDIAIPSTTVTTACRCVKCQCTYTKINSVGISKQIINFDMCTACDKKEERKNQNKRYYLKRKERTKSEAHVTSTLMLSTYASENKKAGISIDDNIHSEVTIPFNCAETDMCAPCDKKEKRKIQNKRYYLKRKEQATSTAYVASTSTIATSGRKKKHARLNVDHTNCAETSAAPTANIYLDSSFPLPAEQITVGPSTNNINSSIRTSRKRIKNKRNYLKQKQRARSENHNASCSSTPAAKKQRTKININDIIRPVSFEQQFMLNGTTPSSSAHDHVLPSGFPADSSYLDSNLPLPLIDQNISSSNITEKNRPRSKYAFAPPNQICTNCNAVVWKEEMIKGDRRTAAHYNICCNNGRVILPPFNIHHHYLTLCLIHCRFHPTPEYFTVTFYPILFPYGEDGWYPTLKNNRITGKKGCRQKVTMKDYYAFRLQHRANEGKTLLRGGRLFLQYLVDAYTSLEQNRLWWIQNHQKKLRAELYSGIQDALDSNDHDASKIGRKVIIPSSFTGGPRYMLQNYQDAMSICAWAGPPDIFLTITSNPKWVEISDSLNLIPGQLPEDRPDIVSRVFHIKQKKLMHLLLSKNFSGPTISGTYRE